MIQISAWSMRYAARAVWAQFELLLLQKGVLYIKSAAHTTQAKLRMVLPKQLKEKDLVEAHDGVPWMNEESNEDIS